MRKMIALLMVVALVALAAGPAGARQVSFRRISPSITLRVLKRHSPAQRIRVLTVNLARGSRVKPVLATEVLPGFETTSSMARRKGAVVAVNGDYARRSGRPVFTFARGGRIDQTELTFGRNFALRRDESSAFFGHPHLRIALESVGHAPLTVGRVNGGLPGPEGIGLFTRSGSSDARPPRNSCSARLVADGVPRIASDGSGVTNSYRVQTVSCSARRLWLLGGIVVAGRRGGRGSKLVRSLAGRGSLSLDWTLGWPEVMETLGGNPSLLEGGANTAGHGSGAFFARHPRTGVGVTRGNRLLLVTVDGRQRGYSTGMTPAGFASVFKSLGARRALNLDGGGSTTMVVRGRVINRPSDGRQRPVSSSLVVVPASRKAPRAAPAPTPQPPEAATQAWRRSAHDPASTGGLAASLQRKRTPLDPGLLEAAQSFTRSRR